LGDLQKVFRDFLKGFKEPPNLRPRFPRERIFEEPCEKVRKLGGETILQSPPNFLGAHQRNKLIGGPKPIKKVFFWNPPRKGLEHPSLKIGKGFFSHPNSPNASN